MKRMISLALAICATSSLAIAQETERWEVSGGYQYTRMDLGSLPTQENMLDQSIGLPALKIPSGLNGNGFTFGLQENVNDWFSGAFTLSAAYPTLNSDITSQMDAFGVQPVLPNDALIAKTKHQLYTFLFGPQFTLRRNPHFQPFVRAAIGGANESFKENVFENGVKLLSSDLRDNDTSLAFGGGGGFDVRVSNRIYFRTAAEAVRMTLFNDTQVNLLLSFGITYRFGER